MRVVVTGVAGFIGSQLAEALAKRGDELVGIDSFSPYYGVERKRANLGALAGDDVFTLVVGDINELDLESLLEGIDVVYHLAGQPGVGASWGQAFDVYLAQNVLTTQKLLEAGKATNVKRFVLASSSSIYGQAERFPTRESDVPRPVSPYGVTKAAAEQLCHLYEQAFGIESVILRYFTIFGPRQRPDMLFSRMISSALDSRPLTIIGDGHQSRDFTYVADAVAATIAAADTGISGSTYNIAGGSQATVLEVVELLEQLVGRPLACEHVDPVPGDLRKTGADTSAARRDLTSPIHHRFLSKTGSPGNSSTLGRRKRRGLLSTRTGRART